MSNSPLTTVIRSLHFQQDRRAELRSVHPDQWPALLKQTDHSQLTLPLGIRCLDYMPDVVRRRIGQNLISNAARHRLFDAEYRLISETFRARSIDFIVLKGPSQIAPLYVANADYRPQYDIDLYCPPDGVAAARDALSSIGFLALPAAGAKYSDHLPPMIRDLDWKWRGDYYAPDLPLTVEVHFRFWDTQTEKVPAPCVEDFWQRRCNRIVGDTELPMLSLADGISYGALHFMRHLLRGDTRLYHAYEIAHFLHQTEHDDELWTTWIAGRSETSTLEAVAFRLAAAWFGCKFNPIVDEQMKRLPARVTRWFDLFSHSPLDLERPNKDELFLHLSLLDNPRDRFSVMVRRLLPQPPKKYTEPVPTDAKRSLRAAVHTKLRTVTFFGARAAHHARTAANLTRSVYLWKFSGRKYAVS